jgi:hypothetical protein
MEDVLVVVVPSSRSSSGGDPEYSFTGKEPSPKRKQRWEQLNEIMEENGIKTKTSDSTEYSYVTWNQVKSVFSPTRYIQPRSSIDDTQLDLIAQYLAITKRCFVGVTSANKAKRLYFISPVMIGVCVPFDGDVDIFVEEDLVGNFVEAHSHF